jgi:hypothetical protein
VPVRDLVLNVDPPRSYKPTGRKILAWGITNSVIGAAAFITTCIGLRAVLPFPAIDDGVSQKFRFFSAHKDEFDTLFIGSSRIYFQISPAIFDRVAREKGWPTHSFNFGIGGMYLPESAYMLEEILNLKPRNLKWIFIEYDDLQTEWSIENQTSRRALYWVDWKRLSLLLRQLTDAGTDPRWSPNLTKLRDIILQRQDEMNTRKLLAFYLTQFEKNCTNVARATDIPDYFLRRTANKQRLSYLGTTNDGYVPKQNRASPTGAAAYERQLAAAMAETDLRSISPYAVEAYRQCAQEVRSIGAVPIFLITPTTTQFNIAYSEGSSSPAMMMAFNNPRAYPGLYRPSARRDEQHLTKSAAEEFTRIVAANFVELAQAGKIK